MTADGGWTPHLVRRTLPSAIAVQGALARANLDVSDERRVRFRIGVHVGDVMVRGGDLLGDGVNIAARLEGLAKPGGICLSAAAHEYARKILVIPAEDLGLQSVKNIVEPVRVFSIKAPASTVARPVASRSERWDQPRG